MKGILLIIICCVTSANSNAYFQQIGWINPAPSYGHIHLAINIDIIGNHINKVKEGLGSMRKAVNSLTHANVKRRASTFFEKMEINLAEVTNEFDSFKEIIDEIPNDRRRTKRFFGLLVALGAMSLGILNRAELMSLHASVSTIATQQNHIIDILQEHEVSIHKVKHDMQIIIAGLEKVMNTVDENHALTIIHEGELQIIMAMSEIRRILVCIQHGMERLLSKRLPICFLEPHQMKKSLEKLQQKAQNENMEVLSLKAMAMLEFETSIIIIKGTINVYIHVPLWMTNQQLELMKFKNVPIQATENMTLNIINEEKYLAIGKDNIYATLNNLEFDKLQEYDGRFFTSSSIILNKDITNSCIGAIFRQNLTALKERCHIKINKRKETLIPLSEDSYILQTTKPQTISMECKTRIEHLAISREETINLKQGCKLETEEHVIFAGKNINEEEKVHKWPIHWEVTNLFDLKAKEFEELVKELELIKERPTTIRNFKQIILGKSSYPSHQQQNIYLSIFLGILVMLILVMLGYLAMRYRRISRAATIKVDNSRGHEIE